MLHLDWAEIEMFRITALDSGWPPLCMFMLPVRGPLFMDNWRTQIIIPPPVKNLLLLSAQSCHAFVYAHAAFWLPVYYYSVSAEPEGTRPVSPRCQAFFLPFPVCDIIVYSPNTTHTHTHTSWLQPGWRTRCTHFGCGVFLVLDTVMSTVKAAPLRSLTWVPLTVMKHGAGYGVFSSNL